MLSGKIPTIVQFVLCMKLRHEKPSKNEDEEKFCIQGMSSISHFNRYCPSNPLDEMRGRLCGHFQLRWHQSTLTI